MNNPTSIHLLSVPMDVLDEIMTYLEPLDILQLARVSSRFRSILMTRNAKHVWHKAMENIEMPECPKDMSEPYYVSWVCEAMCFSCGGEPGEIIPEFKLRFCSSCFKNQVGQWGKAGVNAPKLAGTVPLYGPASCYLISKFKEVLAQYQGLSHDKSALQRFVNSRIAIVQEAEKFAKTLNVWVNTRIRQKLLQVGYEERDFPCWPNCRSDLVVKWNLLVKQYMNNPYDNYWESVLRFKFEYIIEENITAQRTYEDQRCQDVRRGEFLHHFFEFCVDASHYDYIMPVPAEVLRFQVVKDLVAEDDYRIELTRERFESIIDPLRVALEGFTSMIRRDLALMVIAGDETVTACTPSEYRALLEMATTLFHCSSCTKFFHYEELCGHRCIYAFELRRNAVSITCEMLRNCASVKSYTRVLGRQVLSILGMPEDSTYEDMKHLETNQELACLCGHPRFKNPATFTALVGHLVEENIWYEEKQASRIGRTRNSDPRLKNSGARLINDHDTSVLSSQLVYLAPGQKIHDIVREGWDSLDNTKKVPSAARWTYCQLCLELTGTREFLRGDKKLTAYHMKAKHGVDC